MQNKNNKPNIKNKKDKDWGGNSQSVFSNLGASSHSEFERQTHDYYATEPKAVRLLLELEDFTDDIWECACGELLLNEGNKVAFLLPVRYLEGKQRKEIFKQNPPETIYISSSRIECGMNGIFKNESAVAYAWFIWKKGYIGETTLKWFN